MSDSPEYNREDDIYWEVRRKYYNVSNYTYGPFKDWNETDVKTSVEYLEKSLVPMLGHAIAQRKKIKEMEQQLKTCRNDALNEAANVVETEELECGERYALAASIRRLKDET